MLFKKAKLMNCRFVESADTLKASQNHRLFINSNETDFMTTLTHIKATYAVTKFYQNFYNWNPRLMICNVLFNSCC